ncbi:hypothetical protein [Viridibacillus arvi]|uniref:hypothetical protein n=1 Tax=Viridibacillus arvi TaxID=263475 RepID=UPI003D29C3DE
MFEPVIHNSQIQDFYTKLKNRKAAIKAKMEHGEMFTKIDQNSNEVMALRDKGYLVALELILFEMECEFQIYNTDNPESTIERRIMH